MFVISSLLLALFVPLATSSTELMPLNLMTFNIRYANEKDGVNRWELRRDLFLRVIREEKPDVLGVQEALKGQLEEMERALPEYDSVGVGRDDGKAAGEHSQIWYLKERFEVKEHGTFWFSEMPDVPGSMHWGNRITRICTWAQLQDRATGKVFAVYNLHLDHESQPSREKSAELLLKRIGERKPKLPAIVIGDFNAGETNAAVTAITKASAPKLRDTFRVKHPKVEDAGTFHGFTGKPGTDKIDYLFVTGEFKVEDAAIVRTHDAALYPSDHFPVTARVLLK